MQAAAFKGAYRRKAAGTTAQERVSGTFHGVSPVSQSETVRQFQSRDLVIWRSRDGDLAISRLLFCEVPIGWSIPRLFPRKVLGFTKCLAASIISSMNPHEMAKALGRRGGRARARRLSAEERKRIASLGGQARRRSREAARRMATNLRYAAAVLELRGGPPKVMRMRTFEGPLPGIHQPRS